MSNFKTFEFSSFFPLLIRIFECIRIWRTYVIIKVKMSHIEAKSINICQRYDPKCKLTI